jgi:beta-galactosidase
MTETVLPSRLHLGSAYYPEHWPEERWPEDIRLMKDANLTVARLAEFAWSTMEPSEGIIQLDWLERAVNLLAENGIATVLGTPTAAPPAWLTSTYPDVFAIDERGRPVQHGNRCHYCPTSPNMIVASARIVRAMAQRFGPNKNIIGWQTDNEFSRVCYCDRCRQSFQQFLAQRYGTLDALNQHWSTAYWSQTYTDWDQIPIPIGPHNPGLMLEFKRFVTATNRQFQKYQVDILRPCLLSGVWITHNFMGWFDGFDHYDFSKDLDIASWDYYVGTGHHDYLSHGAIHDLTRGFKHKNYWVMETQPGSVNWSGINNMLNQGEGRVMAWQGVAHGADGILYWQWRSALGGQEQYHGSLIDQSGQPRPFYEEVKQLGKEFSSVSKLIAGSVPKARIAMLNSYESRWSIQWQRHHRDFDYVQHFNHYYRPLAAKNIPVDILPADHITDEKEISAYKLIIAPALLIVTEKLAEALKAFVSRGGNLVLTIRTGMKDPYNALLPMRQPGLLREVTGLEVEDFFALDEPVPVKGPFISGQSRLWAERLKQVTKTRPAIIARFEKCNGWLDDQLAIAMSPYGMGVVYYVGAYLDDASQIALMSTILAASLIKPLVTPPGVEHHTRTTPEGAEIHFVINHEREEKILPIPWPAWDHLTGQRVEKVVKLPPYGVVVITQTT